MFQFLFRQEIANIGLFFLFFLSNNFFKFFTVVRTDSGKHGALSFSITNILSGTPTCVMGITMSCTKCLYVRLNFFFFFSDV